MYIQVDIVNKCVRKEGQQILWAQHYSLDGTGKRGG